MKSKRLATFLVIFVISLFSNGCSLIGLGIGAIGDALEQDYTPVKIVQLKNIKRGETVKISLKDNRHAVGEFLEFKPPLQNTYFFKYNHYLDTSRFGGKLPHTDEKIVIYKVDGKKAECNFLGIGRECIFCRTIDADILRTRFSEIKSLSSGNGYTYYIKNIKEIVRKAEFPVLLSEDELKLPILFIYTNRKKKSFAQDEITRIETETIKNGKWVGFFLGLSIDAFIIYKIISNPIGVNLSGLGSL